MSTGLPPQVATQRVALESELARCRWLGCADASPSGARPATSSPTATGSPRRRKCNTRQVTSSLSFDASDLPDLRDRPGLDNTSSLLWLMFYLSESWCGW